MVEFYYKKSDQDCLNKMNFNHKTIFLKMSLFSKLFLDHPHEQDESYLKHMTMAICLGSRLLIASQFQFIHSVVPGFDGFKLFFGMTSEEYLNSIIKTTKRGKK